MKKTGVCWKIHKLRDSVSILFISMKKPQKKSYQISLHKNIIKIKQKQPRKIRKMKNGNK